MPDVTIQITAKDKFSEAVKSMRSAGSAFQKDLIGLEEKLRALDKVKTSVKVDTDAARKALREAEAQYGKTGSAADGLKTELMQANYEGARRNLSLITQEAAKAEKEIISLSTAQGKLENRAGSGKTGLETDVRAGGAGGKAGGFLKTFASSGALEAVGALGVEVATTYVTRAFGDEAGTMVSSVLSGAVSGAAIGTAFGPGIGTAIGAVAGGIGGAISGNMKNAEKQDDDFRDAVRFVYDDVTRKQAEDLSAGSGIAAKRETDQFAFTQLLGSGAAAEELMSGISGLSHKGALQYDDLAQLSKMLAASGYSAYEMVGAEAVLQKIGDAGVARGMGIAEMQEVAAVIGQIKSSGMVGGDSIAVLQSHGLDAMGYLAEKRGVSQDDVQKELAGGKILGEAVATAILEGLQRDYGETDVRKGVMEQKGETFEGVQSRLKGARDELDAAEGEAYDETKIIGMKSEMDMLTGPVGDKLKDARALMGKHKAELENERNQARLAAMEGLVEDTDFTNAMAEGNGAEIGRLLGMAEAEAEAAYLASEGYALELATQQKLVGDIQVAIAPVYETFGRAMGQQFAKGLDDAKARILDSILEGDMAGNPKVFEWLGVYREKNELAKPGLSPVSTATGALKFLPGIAFGLARVPKDDYPVRLHQGERVLTAVEARQYNRGATTGPVVNMTGPVTIRSEADLDALAARFADKLLAAQKITA